MGKHHRRKQHRVAPQILLALSILSVGSPVGLAMAVSQEEAAPRDDEPTIDTLDDSWLALPQGPPNLVREAIAQHSTTAKRAAKRVTKHATTPTATKEPLKPKPVLKQKQPPTTTTTTAKSKAVTTTSKPHPTTSKSSTTTSKPRATVAERQIAKATSTTQKTTTTPPPTTTSKKPATTTTTTEPKKTTTAQALSGPASTSRIVEVAKRYVGRNMPYRFGGDSPTTGIDCSHFIWRVLKEAGYSVPYRDSSGLAKWATRTSNPQPGDLVLYRGHVGIYAGNGMMVHHGRSGGAFFVKVYTNNFIGYGRMPL